MSDDGEDQAAYFSLTPVDESLLPLTSGQGLICQQWPLDFHAGRVALDSRPRGTHARHAVLDAAIATARAQTAGRAQSFTVALPQACCAHGKRAGGGVSPRWQAQAYREGRGRHTRCAPYPLRHTRLFDGNARTRPLFGGINPVCAAQGQAHEGRGSRSSA